MIEWDWSVEATEVAADHLGLKDVVMIVHARLIGRAAGRAAEADVKVPLCDPVESGFIPFDELTPAIVARWTVTALGDAAIRQLAAEVEAKLIKVDQPVALKVRRLKG